jgi:hypothetical protein
MSYNLLLIASGACSYPQATEWQRIGNQVDAAMIVPRADFVKVQGMHSGWLLRSDIGEVIKTIVDDEAFPDYAMPKTAGRKKRKL